MIRIGPSPIAIAIALTAAPAHAASDEQVWATASANVKFADKWRLSGEVVTRFSDNRHGLYEVEATTLLGYRVAKNIMLWAGYVHDPLYAGGDYTATEHRIREQITFDNVARLGPGKFSARMRLEQRWRNGVDGTAWRLRPYLKYSLPLRGKTALNFSSEPFIDLGTTSFQKVDGLDRIRNLVTISTPLSKRLSGEVGYMNQHGFVRRGADTSDHIAYFALSVSL